MKRMQRMRGKKTWRGKGEMSRWASCRVGGMVTTLEPQHIGKGK